MNGKHGFLDDHPSQKERFVFFILILLAVFELFWRLGSGVLYWDEAIYAQVSKETIQNGDWLTLQWNGQPWFQKPPVYFWVTALLFRVFKVSEFWARAASALSGVGVILVSYLIARLLYNYVAGILTVLILLSSELFVFYARFGTTDTMLTFFVLLAVYGYLRAQEGERFWLLACVGCALALMVKGTAGVIAAAALILTALVQRRLFTALRSKWLWLGVAWAAIIVIPWHAWLFKRHGYSFVDEYLVRHVFNRARSNINEYQRGYGYYFSVLRDFFSPWVYIVPLALIFNRAANSKVLSILAVLVMCLYTIVQTKFQWYILPAIPAFAIIIAGFVVKSVENRPRTQVRLAILAIALLWVAGAAAVISRIVRTNPEIDAAARLAKVAERDAGGIVAYPENLEMTVRYYSGRKLCTDPVLSTLSHSRITECLPKEATHIILRKIDLTKIESRYNVNPLIEDGALIYAVITPKDGPVLGGPGNH